MESRKRRNLQIENRKRMERRITTAIVVAIIAVIVGGIGFGVWDSVDRRTVMTFHGQRIPTSDFMYFHMMSGAEPGNEAMREVALDNMIQTLVLMERAERHGMTVPSEEMELLETQASGMRDAIISQNPTALRSTNSRRIANFMSVDAGQPMWGQPPGPLFSMLMDKYLSDFEPDRELVDEAVEEWMSDIIEVATEKTVKYLAADDWDAAWEASQLYSNGEAHFDDLITMFHSPREEDEGLESPADLWAFGGHFEAWTHWEDQWQEITQMQDGEVSTVLMMGDRFFIVQMYESILNQERLEETIEEATEIIVNEQRDTAFNELIRQWVSEARYQRNERALVRI
jgi:hypothetical protein